MGAPNLAIVADSSGLLALAKAARGAWGATLREALDGIDPEGLHVLATQFLHNDCEWRTCWLAKLAGDREPVTLWLDIPMDGSLERYTGTVDIPTR